MRVSTITVLAIALASCGDGNSKIPINAQTDAVATDASSRSKPAPNYAQEENGVYYYIAGLSEEDRKKGQAAGDVLGYKYYGKNAEGEHVIANVLSAKGKETEILRSSCTDPCVIIKHPDGTRIAYNPESVIGAAFQDAIHGNLKVSEDKVAAAEAALAALDSWTGNWNARFDGAKGAIDMTRSGDKIAISMGMGSETCMGSIEGLATPKGNSMIMRMPKDDSGDSCRITFNRQGNKMTVKEQGCIYYHGMSCSFDGIATR